MCELDNLPLFYNFVIPLQFSRAVFFNLNFNFKGVFFFFFFFLKVFFFFFGKFKFIIFFFIFFWVVFVVFLLFNNDVDATAYRQTRA